jgi:rubrerythrin
VLTRRTAIVSGSSALLLAGCGGRPARLIAGDAADLPVLAAALEVERAQIALYEAGLKLVDGGEAALVRTILSHERRHAESVTEAILELGGKPAGARGGDAYTRGIPRGADAWRQHAIQSEELWSAGYGTLIPKLHNRRLRATFGALMATEAEHAVALTVR